MPVMQAALKKIPDLLDTLQRMQGCADKYLEGRAVELLQEVTQSPICGVKVSSANDK